MIPTGPVAPVAEVPMADDCYVWNSPVALGWAGAERHLLQMEDIAVIQGGYGANHASVVDSEVSSCWSSISFRMCAIMRWRLSLRIADTGRLRSSLTRIVSSVISPDQVVLQITKGHRG